MKQYFADKAVKNNHWIFDFFAGKEVEDAEVIRWDYSDPIEGHEVNYFPIAPWATEEDVSYLSWLIARRYCAV